MVPYYNATYMIILLFFDGGCFVLNVITNEVDSHLINGFFVSCEIKVFELEFFSLLESELVGMS